MNLSCECAGIINFLCRVQSSESKEAGQRLELGYCLTKETRVAPWLRLAAIPITSSKSSPHKQGFFKNFSGIVDIKVTFVFYKYLPFG